MLNAICWPGLNQPYTTLAKEVVTHTLIFFDPGPPSFVLVNSNGGGETVLFARKAMIKMTMFRLDFFIVLCFRLSKFFWFIDKSVFFSDS